MLRMTASNITVVLSYVIDALTVSSRIYANIPVVRVKVSRARGRCQEVIARETEK